MINDDFVKWLRTLADDVEAGRVELRSFEANAGIGDVSGAGSGYRTPAHTGRETWTLSILRKETEAAFRKQYEANRMSGVPIWLDDALR